MKNVPIKEEILDFWNEQNGEKIQCNEEVYWIKTLPTKFKHGMEPSIWKKSHNGINLLKPNDIYMCRTAALTSRRYILNIYSTNIRTEYFKHAA